MNSEKTEFGIIQRIEKFKYLGKNLTPKGSENEALGERARKLQIQIHVLPGKTATLLHNSQTKMPLHCITSTNESSSERSRAQESVRRI